MSEWQEVSLTDAFDIGSGLSKPASEFGSGFPFLSFKEIFNNFFVPKELPELVESSRQERDKCSVQKGDVFLTRTSETVKELGMSCVALKDYENATFNGFTKRLRPNGAFDIVPEYAGYYFRSSKFRNEVTALSSASTRASLNNEMLGRLTITLPSKEEQREIASVLICLDRKIENLRRQNETLEAIAQTLFKHWFVDFEFPNDDGKPYKSSGGEMVPSAIGEIPAGWRIGKLGDFCTIFRGSSPRPITSPVFFKDGNIPWIKIADATKSSSIYLSETKEFCTEAALPHTRLLKKGSLILSNSATVGIPMILNLDGCIHDGWLSFKNYKIITRNFLFFTLANKLKFLTKYADGTVQKNLNTGILKNMDFVVADEMVIQKFTTTIQTLFDKILVNERQIQTLTKTRDVLLPQLMSGKLRIQEGNHE
jgi:type I restriction enzyme S subunit